jgi:hypothetical protein
MKYLFLVAFVLFTIEQISAQVTFEKIYGAGQFNSAIELDSNYYLLGGSDSLHGGIFQLDANGNFISSFNPMLRGEYVTVADIERDTISGGVAMCGTSADTSGGNVTGYYLVVDSLFQNLDNVLYSGGINGPDGVSILRTSTNDYIVGTETWFGAGSYASIGNKVIYSGTASWTAGGGSNLSSNGMDLDANDNLLIAGFSWTAAAAAHLDLYNSAGGNLYSFDITDTAYGNSLVFESCTAAGPDNTYLFGVDLSPSATAYSLPYINCLDTQLNVLWQKYLDWGFNVNLISMQKTADSCIIYLLGTDNGMALYKCKPNGDSLWIQYHNRPTTGLGIRFMECRDRGFLIAGTWSDSVFISHQYLLKTDSLGRLLPPAFITTSGQPVVCAGDSIQLTAPAGYSYLWSTSDTAQSIYVMQPGGYAVQVTDTNSVSAVSDTFYFSNYPPQALTLNYNSPVLSVTPTGVSYQWFVFGTPIPGANDSTYTVVADGDYSVEVTDSNGCTSLSGNFLILAVDEVLSASDIVDLPREIVARNKSGIDRIRVFDLTGKIVYDKHFGRPDAIISKTELNSGIYVILVISSDGKLAQKKFVCY